MEILKPINFEPSDRVLSDDTLILIMTVVALAKGSTVDARDVEYEYLRSKAFVADYRRSGD